MAVESKKRGKKQIRTVANGIRGLVLSHTISNGGGYLSQACSSAEIIASLYLGIMKLGDLEGPMIPDAFCGAPGPLNPGYKSGAPFNGPREPELDRFILSPSQYALVLYAALVKLGRMAPEGLAQFNQDGSTVEMIGAEHSPGMEMMTGSLGQGLSQAAGMAMGRRLKGESGRVWVFMSDGEFQSGQVWEAVQSMVFHRLDNVGVYVDMNGQQCDGRISSVMPIEPLEKRLESFGARVFRVDGHDSKALIRPSRLKPNGKPLFVLADTCPWKGIDIIQEKAPKMHYIRFDSETERGFYLRWLAAYEVARR